MEEVSRWQTLRYDTNRFKPVSPLRFQFQVCAAASPELAGQQAREALGCCRAGMLLLGNFHERGRDGPAGTPDACCLVARAPLPRLMTCLGLEWHQSEAARLALELDLLAGGEEGDERALAVRRLARELDGAHLPGPAMQFQVSTSGVDASSEREAPSRALFVISHRAAAALVGRIVRGAGGGDVALGQHSKALVRWFTLHLWRRLLVTQLEARQAQHAQAAAAAGRELTGEERAGEGGDGWGAHRSFLDAYTGMMRAYDPPFLVVFCLPEKIPIVVLLRDVAALADAMTDLPAMKGARVVSRPRHVHSFMTYVPETMCARGQCTSVLAPAADPAQMHLFQDHEGPRERFHREHVNKMADALLKERSVSPSNNIQMDYWTTVQHRRDAMDAEYESTHSRGRLSTSSGVCGGCGANLYCSQNCAQADWAFHGPVCGK
mmetsp:Transcript_41657/g.79596  ORF Transcript_41657/g.79596 Transcript_41657/m.79596 type:complete len:436 (+) Transcript_41657:986-2293(+)